MKRWIAVALVACATLAHAQGNSKKELVGKILQSQQAIFDGVARNVVERPAFQIAQAANQAMAQVPADKREAVGKQIQAELQKYVDDSTPLLRDRARALAPSTYGAVLEERFSEDELKQMLAWFESPLYKKYQAALPDLDKAFVPKLIAEAPAVLDPKLAALQDKIRGLLGIPAPQAAASAAKPARAASPPARAASK